MWYVTYYGKVIVDCQRFKKLLLVPVGLHELWEGKMADDKMKLPRSSYEELSKIIQAYGKNEKPVGLAIITQLTGINNTGISANNAFLLAVEIVQGTTLKSPTPKGKALGHALEHEYQEEVTRAWRIIVVENDFLSKMVQAIGVRKGMDENQLVNHIAYSAGEAKSKPVLTGARTVIDILKYSGLVRQEGDRILPNPSIGSLLPIDHGQISSPENSTGENVGESQSNSNKIMTNDINGNKGVNIHIEVRINATPSDLDGLGEKLKQLIDEISK